MTNPTPVAWPMATWSDLKPIDPDKPNYSLRQLRQAKADALREAADWFVEYEYTGAGAQYLLRSMADRIEGEKG